MIRCRIILLLALVGQLHWLNAQNSPDSLRIWVSEALVDQGNQADIFLSVANFDSLVSVQFSINWDPAIIDYVEFERLDLNSVAIGQGDTDQGRLRFSWFSPEGVVETLADSSRILRLRFTAIGPFASSSPVDITNNPLQIQVFKGEGENSGEFIPVPVALEQGRVRVGAPFNVIYDSTEPICRGDSTGSITYSTTADLEIYTVFWQNQDGELIPDDQLDSLPAGTYEIRIIDDLGMEVFSGFVTLTQPSLSLLLNEPDIMPTGCLDPAGTVELSANGGDAPYLYTLGQTASVSGNFGMLPAGVYPIVVSDERGCFITSELEVGQAPDPELDLGEELRSFCGNTPILLQASVNEPVDFTWETGENEPVLLATNPGIYILTVTNAAGCTDIDTVQILQGENVQAILETPLFPLCPGDSIRLELSGGTDFEWIGTSAGLSATDSRTVWARPEETTTYQFTVSTDCSNDTLEIPVEIFELTATAGIDTCVVIGESIQLRASGGLFYTWEDSPFPVDNPVIPNPVVSPEITTTYEVLIEDINGCLVRDEVIVALAEDPAANILAVNAITPNNDGDNDVLEFVGSAKFGSNSLRIYNRWGRLVYNKVDYGLDEERFDGTYLEDPLPAGTYYYVLEFRTGTIKQTLLIIR